MSHEYPYDEGDTIVIGPECFATRDGSVLSWRGENYVPQQAPLVPVSAVVEFLREAAAASYRRESKHADGFTIAADLIEARAFSTPLVPEKARAEERAKVVSEVAEWLRDHGTLQGRPVGQNTWYALADLIEAHFAPGTEAKP